MGNDERSRRRVDGKNRRGHERVTGGESRHETGDGQSDDQRDTVAEGSVHGPFCRDFTNGFWSDSGGADHFYEHLIDGDAAINYTQWQSQCGLVGRPGLRLYDPRKQVRDQDPDGEFIGRWVPELDPLPAAHLDAPEKAPLAVQREAGVEVGADYPRRVVDYERARLEFRERYGDAFDAAATRLGDEEIARRASLSGGIEGARSIAAEHGEPAGSGASDADESAQTGLDEFG